MYGSETWIIRDFNHVEWNAEVPNCDVSYVIRLFVEGITNLYRVAVGLVNAVLPIAEFGQPLT